MKSIKSRVTFHGGLTKEEIEAFKITFRTPEGQTVLKKLNAMYNKSPYKQFVEGKENKIDPLDVMWRVGRQSVVEKINETLEIE